MPPRDQDNFAAAARRHLIDAAVLLHQERWDGAVYLSGYVIECALKELVERWLGPVGRKFSHELAALESCLLGTGDFELLVALSPTARPLRLWSQVAGTLAAHKHPVRRYYKDGWMAQEAESVLELASQVFKSMLVEDMLDGRLSF